MKMINLPPVGPVRTTIAGMVSVWQVVLLLCLFGISLVLSFCDRMSFPFPRTSMFLRNFLSCFEVTFSQHFKL